MFLTYCQSRSGYLGISFSHFFYALIIICLLFLFCLYSFLSAASFLLKYASIIAFCLLMYVNQVLYTFHNLFCFVDSYHATELCLCSCLRSGFGAFGLPFNTPLASNISPPLPNDNITDASCAMPGDLVSIAL